MPETLTQIAPPSEDAILESAEFHQLAARKNTVAILLTALIMTAYYGFIFLIAFRKDLVGAKISAHVTWGIPLGLGVIAISWLLTGVYVLWANRIYDVLVAGFRKKWSK